MSLFLSLLQPLFLPLPLSFPSSPLFLSLLDFSFISHFFPFFNLPPCLSPTLPLSHPVFYFFNFLYLLLSYPSLTRLSVSPQLFLYLCLSSPFINSLSISLKHFLYLPLSTPSSTSLPVSPHLFLYFPLYFTSITSFPFSP